MTVDAIPTQQIVSRVHSRTAEKRVALELRTNTGSQTANQTAAMGPTSRHSASTEVQLQFDSGVRSASFTTGWCTKGFSVLRESML